MNSGESKHLPILLGYEDASVVPCQSLPDAKMFSRIRNHLIWEGAMGEMARAFNRLSSFMLGMGSILNIHGASAVNDAYTLRVRADRQELMARSAARRKAMQRDSAESMNADLQNVVNDFNAVFERKRREVLRG